MIMICVLDYFVAQAIVDTYGSDYLYNRKTSLEREAFDKEMRNRGKEEDFYIYTLPMGIGVPCFLTECIKPFLDERGFIRQDAYGKAHNVNGYDVRIVTKHLPPQKSQNFSCDFV